MKYTFVSMKPSSDKVHKFEVTLQEKTQAQTQTPGKLHVVRFGAVEYSDYTKHKDDERKQRYIIRHQKRENWKISGVLTAGFWSRWVLWNKKTLKESVDDTKQKFNL